MNNQRVHSLVYIALFAALLTICAWITIPVTIPFTMQTLAVFLAPLVLGGKRGSLAVAVYLLYLALLAWTLSHEKRHSDTGNGKSGKESGGCTAGQISEVAGLTLLSILCNVGLVSLVIFCQTRYTIYNMPLFYISLILLLYNFLLVKRRQMV